MGDHIQSFIRTDIADDEAPARAEDVRRWLVEEGILLDTQTDCVLGAPTGNPPGPNWRSAVQDGALGGDRFLGLWTNGAEIRGGERNVDGCQGDLFGICPSCQTSQAFTDDFGRAMGAWVNKEGDSVVACAVCGVRSDITAWTFTCVALSVLSVTFWNWPQFSASFVSDLTDRLGGDARTFAGKL